MQKVKENTYQPGEEQQAHINTVRQNIDITQVLRPSVFILGLDDMFIEPFKSVNILVSLVLDIQTAAKSLSFQFMITQEV